MVRESLLIEKKQSNEKRSSLGLESTNEKSEILMDSQTNGKHEIELKSSRVEEKQVTGLCGVLSDVKEDILMFKHLFAPREYFIKTCLLFYLWAALMLLYYGISLGKK